MAGTVTTSLTKLDKKMELTFAWTASSSDGTVPATAVPAHIAKTIKGLSIILGTTNPGSTAPTDNYSVTLTDVDGIDVFGGAMATRSSTASEQVVPYLSGGSGSRATTGALTLNVTNNSVNSATGVVKVYLA